MDLTDAERQLIELMRHDQRFAVTINRDGNRWHIRLEDPESGKSGIGTGTDLRQRGGFPWGPEVAAGAAAGSVNYSVSSGSGRSRFLTGVAAGAALFHCGCSGMRDIVGESSGHQGGCRLSRWRPLVTRNLDLLCNLGILLLRPVLARAYCSENCAPVAALRRSAPFPRGHCPK
jgi:hypothetical protein